MGASIVDQWRSQSRQQRNVSVNTGGTACSNGLGLFGREARVTIKVSGLVTQVQKLMVRANDRIKNTPETEAANVNYSKEGGGVFCNCLGSWLSNGRRRGGGDYEANSAGAAIIVVECCGEMLVVIVVKTLVI